MPSNKPKIAAYLHQSLFDKFKDFASENNYSDSMAMSHILEMFFNTDSDRDNKTEVMTTKQLNIRISPELFKAIQSAGATQNLSPTNYAIAALQYCLDNKISFLPIREILIEHLGLLNADSSAYSQTQAIEDRLSAMESRIEAKLEVIDKLAEVLTAFKK